jgi:3-oxoacyl-[acyl-carrier-protein] synthase II
VAAAQRALHDAGVVGRLDADRSGVVFGSDYMLSEPTEFSSGMRRAESGGAVPPTRWAADGLAAMSPLWLLKYLPNMPACHVAIYNDLRGPSNSLTLREASSNAAVGEACRVIQRGGADLLVAGATGTRLHPMKTLHAILQEEVAGNGTAPHTASRPFDRRRSGMVLGEGAGVVILEDLETARRRGARIYGEVLGVGSSSVADRRGIADRRRALSNALRAALADAQLAPEKLGHVHAHGLSTRSCDIDEAAALADALGPAVERIPVAAAKSYFGNLGAGSGAVELICSLMAMERGHLFSTLNYDEPDPECSLRVVRSPETPAGDTFVNLNVTPQGQASALVVGRFAD